MNEHTKKQYWVTVHTDECGPYPNHASAFDAAKKLKHQNPNKHVAVRDPKGIDSRRLGRAAKRRNQLDDRLLGQIGLSAQIVRFQNLVDVAR